MLIILLLLLLIVIGLLLAFTRWKTSVIERDAPGIGELIDVGGFRMNSVLLPAGPAADLPPILFIHGASGNLRDQLFAFRGALQGRADLLFVDRPGHGYSERGGPENGFPDGQADAIARLMGKRGINLWKRVTVIVDRLRIPKENALLQIREVRPDRNLPIFANDCRPVVTQEQRIICPVPRRCDVNKKTVFCLPNTVMFRHHQRVGFARGVIRVDHSPKRPAMHTPAALFQSNVFSGYMAESGEIAIVLISYEDRDARKAI